MAEGVCQEHSGCMADIKNIGKQTDTNTAKLGSLEEAVLKLTFIVEKMEKDDAPQPAPKENFWNTKAGEKVPLFAFLTFIVLIAALAGTNAIDAIQAAQVLPIK